VPTQFDPDARRIILDTAAITAEQIWSDWVDWSALADNSKWPAAISQVGGDGLGGGLFIPIYLFLLNGWRVRPMESDHNLVITGNLFVEGGGVPVVNTLGAFSVAVQYTVPVVAQGISTGGGLSPEQSAILDRLLDLAEADEELTQTTATLRQRGTATVLLQKNVTGGVITPVELSE
jgi:hypothetical protein